MSYREKDGDTSTNGLKKVGGLLLALFAFGVAKVAVRSGMDFVQQKSVTSASLETKMEANETVGPTANAMKKYFPAQYHEWTSHVAEMIRSGASDDETFAYSFGFARDLIKTHSKDIAAASDTTLAAIGQQNFKTAQALFADSKEACSEYGFEGLQPQTARQLSKATVSTISAGMPLMLRAAYEGERQPIARPAQLSREDATALIAAVRRQGLSTADVDELFNGKANGEDVLTKCRMTVGLYGAAASLPGGTGARVTAALLSP
jgi:hypothetical protein